MPARVSSSRMGMSMISGYMKPPGEANVLVLLFIYLL